MATKKKPTKKAPSRPADGEHVMDIKVLTVDHHIREDMDGTKEVYVLKGRDAYGKAKVRIASTDPFPFGPKDILQVTLKESQLSVEQFGTLEQQANPGLIDDQTDDD